MKPTLPCRAGFASLALCTALASQAQTQTVTIVTGGHPQGASDVAVVHHAKCAATSYELHIAKAGKQMLFVADGGSRKVTDISATRFGTTFLQRPLLGSFGFSCGSGLNLTFRGVELRAGRPPQVVSYSVTIQNDGTIVDAIGLHDDNLAFLNELI